MSILSEEEKREILELERSGHSRNHISEQYIVSLSTISRAIKWAKDNESDSDEGVSFDPSDRYEAEAAEPVVIATTNNIAIHFPGQGSRIISGDHKYFKRIENKLENGFYEEAYDLMDIPAIIEKYSCGRVTIENGGLSLDGKELHNSLTNRIIEMTLDDADGVKRLVNFMNKVYENPQNSVVTRIYDFLQAADIEIAPNGNILAWKGVRSDFTDNHTGSFDNSPGMTVSMERNAVVDDDEQTCSSGLHICSKKYFDFWYRGSMRIIQVSVNPKDIVSIPIDYNDAKMRCCEYEVLREVSPEELREEDMRFAT